MKNRPHTLRNHPLQRLQPIALLQKVTQPDGPGDPPLQTPLTQVGPETWIDAEKFENVGHECVGGLPGFLIPIDANVVWRKQIQVAFDLRVIEAEFEERIAWADLVPSGSQAPLQVLPKVRT